MDPQVDFTLARWHAATLIKKRACFQWGLYVTPLPQSATVDVKLLGLEGPRSGLYVSPLAQSATLDMQIVMFGRSFFLGGGLKFLGGFGAPPAD